MEYALNGLLTATRRCRGALRGFRGSVAYAVYRNRSQRKIRDRTNRKEDAVRQVTKAENVIRLNIYCDPSNGQDETARR